MSFIKNVAAGLFLATVSFVPFVTGQDNLTPLQRQVEQQRQRLNSSEIEERRDALMKLGSIKQPEASRAAAQALGEIRNRAAVSVLIATLGNDSQSSDVRRAAAVALGSIGDAQAMPALKAAIESSDPYLSEAARSAIRKLETAKN